jgi:hypothetical protein
MLALRALTFFHHAAMFSSPSTTPTTRNLPKKNFPEPKRRQKERIDTSGPDFLLSRRYVLLTIHHANNTKSAKKAPKRAK